MTEGFGRFFADFLVGQALFTHSLHRLLRVGMPERVKTEAFGGSWLFAGFDFGSSVGILELVLVIADPALDTLLLFKDAVVMVIAKQIVSGFLALLLGVSDQLFKQRDLLFGRDRDISTLTAFASRYMKLTGSECVFQITDLDLNALIDAQAKTLTETKSGNNIQMIPSALHLIGNTASFFDLRIHPRAVERTGMPLFKM